VKAIGYLGLLLLVLGVLMGLAKGMVEFFPYSMYFAIVVIVILGVGLYAIHREDNKS